MRVTTAAETEIRDETAELVEAWRAEQLEMAGFTAQAAADLASRNDVDLHFATDLVRRGCPADLALKILL